MYICRFFRFGSLWKILFSVTFLSSFWAAIYVESHSKVHLNYICAEPAAVPEGENNVPVIMLHGVLDVKETWNGIYEKVAALTKRKVCIYDTRNHGDSSWNDTCTIDSTVEDLESFMDMMKINRTVLVGHSLGGLTAMQFALSNPSRVERMFVEDIGPKVPVAAEVGVGFVIRLLERSLFTIPVNADKPTAVKTILKYIRKYIGTQLTIPSFEKHMPIHLHNGVWKWKTNLKAFNEALNDVGSVYSKMEGKFGGKVLFIYGTISVFRVSDQEKQIKELFPNAEFFPVETFNHLIHFVYPDYTKVLLDFLK